MARACSAHHKTPAPANLRHVEAVRRLVERICSSIITRRCLHYSPPARAKLASAGPEECVDVLSRFAPFLATLSLMRVLYNNRNDVDQLTLPIP